MISKGKPIRKILNFIDSAAVGSLNQTKGAQVGEKILMREQHLCAFPTIVTIVRTCYELENAENGKTNKESIHTFKICTSICICHKDNDQVMGGNFLLLPLRCLTNS